MAVVLVTGVSSGFGAAIAEEFERAGHRVVGTARHPSRGDLVALDLTDAASRRACVEEVLARHGRIDVLVNNAGTMVSGALEDTSLELVRAVFETNFFGTVALTQEVLPHMRRQGGGRIVNITAIGALLGTPFLASYCATKHALDCVTVALDEEVRPFNIRVTSVLPGAFKTEIMARAPEVRDSAHYAGEAAQYRAGLQARLEASGPLQPVAELVLRAATDAEPKARYLIASPVMTGVLTPIIDSLEALRGPVTQRPAPTTS